MQKSKIAKILQILFWTKVIKNKEKLKLKLSLKYLSTKEYAKNLQNNKLYIKICEKM